MPKRKIFNSKQINEVIKLYDNKLSLFQIGTHFNVSKTLIRRILEENNIKIRTTGESLTGKLSKQKGIPKSQKQKDKQSEIMKIKLSDGSWYPSIPDICHCNKCNEIVYNGHQYIYGHQLKILVKTEEHKLKIGNSNKGKKRTAEQNKINSNKMKEYYKNNPEIKEFKSKQKLGISLSEEHKQHIKENIPRGENHPKPWLGKHLSEEHKLNISKNSPHLSGKNHPCFGKTGDKHWNYGNHWSKEIKEKIRKNTPIIIGENHPCFGKHPSQKTLKNMSIAQKENYKLHPERIKRGKNSPIYGKPPQHSQRIYPHQTPLQGKILMHRWDRKYAQYLDLINESYEYENHTFELILNNKETTYTPDFYLPNTDEYIEVKGYWRDDSKPKFNKFLETYPDIKIQLLFKEDLKNLGIDLKITKEEKEILNLSKIKKFSKVERASGLS